MLLLALRQVRGQGATMHGEPGGVWPGAQVAGAG